MIIPVRSPLLKISFAVTIAGNITLQIIRYPEERGGDVARDRDEGKSDQEDYESVSKMADRLQLKGKDRSRYIHDHMTGFGYRMVPSYVREDEDGEEEDSRFFGRRSRSSSRSRRSERDAEDDDYPF